jgi:hypothetical protein
MAKGLKKTIYGLVVLTLLALLIGMALFKTTLSPYYFGFFPYLVLFFLIIHAVFFVLFYRSLNQPGNQFVRSFMVSTGGKLMIYVILVLVYVFISPETAVAFAVALAVLYIAYTAYDIVVMLSLLKRKKEN